MNHVTASRYFSVLKLWVSVMALAKTSNYLILVGFLYFCKALDSPDSYILSPKDIQPKRHFQGVLILIS